MRKEGWREMMVRMLSLRGYLPAKVKRILSDMATDEWETSLKREKFTEVQRYEIDEAIRLMRETGVR